MTEADGRQCVEHRELMTKCAYHANAMQLFASHPRGEGSGGEGEGSAVRKGRCATPSGRRARRAGFRVGACVCRVNNTGITRAAPERWVKVGGAGAGEGRAGPGRAEGWA